MQRRQATATIRFRVLRLILKASALVLNPVQYVSGTIQIETVPHIA